MGTHRCRTAVAATLLLALSLGACGGSKGGEETTTAPTYALVPDAQAEAGLQDVLRLVGDAVTLSQSGDSGAGAAATKAVDAWQAIRGTVRARDMIRFLDIDDAVRAIKSGADNGLPDKADAASETLRDAVSAYVPGPGGVPTTLGGKPALVTIDMRDYEITSSPVKAGPVVLKIGNSGTITHEVAVVRTDLAPTDFPLDPSGNFDYRAEAVKLIDQRQNIGPGESAELRVDLPAGRYVFVCNITGHLAKGMYRVVFAA